MMPVFRIDGTINRKGCAYSNSYRQNLTKRTDNRRAIESTINTAVIAIYVAYRELNELIPLVDVLQPAKDIKRYPEAREGINRIKLANEKMQAAYQEYIDSCTDELGQRRVKNIFEYGYDSCYAPIVAAKGALVTSLQHNFGKSQGEKLKAFVQLFIARRILYGAYKINETCAEQWDDSIDNIRRGINNKSVTESFHLVDKAYKFITRNLDIVDSEDYNTACKSLFLLLANKNFYELICEKLHIRPNW